MKKVTKGRKVNYIILPSVIKIFFLAGVIDLAEIVPL